MSKINFNARFVNILVEKGTVSLPAFLDTIMAVVVLYNSPLESSDMFLSLTSSLESIDNDIKLDLVVYDNSPVSVFNKSNQYKNWNIHYINDPSNPGLSKASNESAKMAFSQGKKWIIFMNPDTRFSRDYFLKLFESVNNYDTINLFAPVLVSHNQIVSPSKFVFNRGSALKTITTGINDFKRKSILYSGMLISTEAFKKCGGFNENIKLDFMDFFFIEKYKREYANFFVLDTRCQHDLSSFEQNKAKVLNRFKYYCEGARNYCESYFDYLSLLIVCFLRCTKLALKFRDFSFFSIFFNNFLFKNKISEKTKKD